MAQHRVADGPASHELAANDATSFEAAPFEVAPNEFVAFDQDVESGLEVDDFPLDAFIIPEGMDHLPAGMAEADRRQRQRASELADRLEALAWRLRREGYSALAQQTAHGDPVDALIAGILAGYMGTR